MTTFSQLGVSGEFLRGLEELGITSPTAIQQSAIPFLLENGGDLVAQAQTGTGKTVAFGVPLLMRVDPDQPVIQGLVLAPTRDLAKQIGKHLFRYTKHCTRRIFVEVAAGGDKIDLQIARLRRPTHIVVATPGRLNDLLEARALSLDAVKHLVLDEADEMLTMGFREDILRFSKLTENRTSTWLFSATFQTGIRRLIADLMAPDPKMLTVAKKDVVNRNIQHRYVVCPRHAKDEFIARFLDDHPDDRGMIFCRTRAGAIRLGSELKKQGIAVDVLQGDLSQKDRDKVMRAFRKERSRILISTDVAARGIDIDGLAFVIHRQLPEQTQYYTHRSGRTARAGRKGLSLCLIEPDERERITELEQELGIHFQALR
jgi:Superfamily II DNA and RNA helicases